MRAVSLVSIFRCPVASFPNVSPGFHGSTDSGASMPTMRTPNGFPSMTVESVSPSVTRKLEAPIVTGGSAESAARARRTRVCRESFMGQGSETIVPVHEAIRQ